jgi:pimeloyl-ACP methyl ester carboxylesterase
VLQPANVAQLEWFKSFIGTFAPLSPRETGTRNDFLQIRGLSELPFARIAAPTLIVQGAEDRCVLPVDSQAAAGKIPTATLFTVPEAGHIVEIGPNAAEVQKKITDFLNQYSGGQAQP